MIRVYILPWHIKSYKFIPIDSHRKRCNYGALIVSGQVEFVFFCRLGVALPRADR